MGLDGAGLSRWMDGRVWMWWVKVPRVAAWTILGWWMGLDGACLSGRMDGWAGLGVVSLSGWCMGESWRVAGSGWSGFK